MSETDEERAARERELSDPAAIGGFGSTAIGDFYVRDGVPAEHEWGVQYQGSYESATDGTGRAVRLHARALANTGIPVLLQSYSNTFLDENGVRVGAEAMAEAVKAEVHDLRHQSIRDLRVRVKHLVITNPEMLRSAIVPRSISTELDLEQAMAVREKLYKTTIVYSVWERSTIAPSIASILRRVAECWVPCNENRDLLLRNGIERVVVVPHPWSPTDERAKLVRRDPKWIRGKRFYAIGAWQPRKHFHETIGAFLIAFKPTDDASLTVKTSKHILPDYPSPAASRAIWLRDPRVAQNGWTINNVDRKLAVVMSTVPEDQITKLHFTSNIYVCASRGEAYALPAFDAKIAGNRMLYVGYGGMRDFAAPSDVMIPFEMKPVPALYGWEEGATWAEARVEDIAEAMRKVEPPARYEQPPALANATMERVGSLMRARVLDVIERAKAAG